MFAACKAESENEAIWDKVRARATVATDLGEGMAQLGQQIGELMSTLTKAGQGNSPLNVPSSPRRGVAEGDAPPATQILIMVGVVWTDHPSPQFTHWALGGGTGNGSNGRVTKGLVQGGGHSQLVGPKFSPML